MNSSNKDGYVELEFNPDKTQVFANIFPPHVGGNEVTSQQVMERLRAMGVMYGFRETEIRKAVHMAQDADMPVMKTLVAQGVLPEDGVDARILWKLDESILSQELPRTLDKRLDYFALPASHLVKSGDVLAAVIPARPGSPGKTLTAPLMEVRQNAGRDIRFTPGEGVSISKDKTQFMALWDGYFELRQDKLSVHPVLCEKNDLAVGEYSYSSSVVVEGNVRGSTIRAEGTVAIRGIAAGAMIRARGDVIVSRASRCKIIANGDIIVKETFMHCQAFATGRILAQGNAKIFGGEIVVMQGADVASIGAEDFTETHIIMGEDRVTGFRVQEVDEEIANCEKNIHRITQALRPLGSQWAENMTGERKEMAQKLLDQRNGLENRVRLLLNEKRTLMMSSKRMTESVLVCRGTAHPGVWLHSGEAAYLNESPQAGLLFGLEKNGRSIRMQTLPRIAR
jgi:uncharacterized protein (DUF342 family)